jgi:hypothetical protein
MFKRIPSRVRVQRAVWSSCKRAVCALAWGVAAAYGRHVGSCNRSPRRAAAAFVGVLVSAAFGAFAAAASGDQVRQTVVRYDSAFAAGDYAKACSLLTPTARRNIASFGPGGCRRQLLRGTGFSRAEARQFAHAGVSTPEFHGNLANVTIVPAGGQPANGATLHREKGRWLIALPPAAITPG